jgi:predicted dehydrogenase
MNESGGIVFDALSHHINLQSYFAGKIKKLNKFETKLAFNEINVNDTGIISLIFKNKVLGVIFGNQFQKPNIDEIEFIGTKNNLIFDRIKNQLFLINKKKKLIKIFYETYDELFSNQINNFLICIKKRIQPKTTLSEELENLGKL